MQAFRSSSSRVAWLAVAVAAFATVTAGAPASSQPAPAAAVTAGPVAVADAAPVTVPALQEWQPGGTVFVLPRGAIRVTVDHRYAQQLTDDAHTFAEDLHALTGQTTVVVPAPPAPARRVGDLNLTLAPGWDAHGPEASRLVVDGDVTISGPTGEGVFAGTRSVLQLLAQSDRIPGGAATDWPAYAERSLMVDNGRKYFSPEWARQHIRELSYLKYNQFHWHFSDNAGFRIESKTHPEVVSPEHWTQEQVRELVAYAEKYHVEVLPEIDMPGHMQYALRTHPDLQVVDAAGTRNANNLDPTKPEARAFVRDILDELIPLFSGRYVHTGGDEFTSDWTRFPVLTEWARAKYGPDANAQDAVLDFTNWVDDVVRGHGKTMRIWNDGGQGGSQVQADRDIVLEYWSSQHGGVLAQEFLDKGYRIVNADRDVLYDVPGAAPTYNNLDPRKVYDGWDMTQWHDWIGPNTTPAHHPGILGGQIHLWNDSPNAATEDQEAGRLAMPLRAMAEQLWGSERRAGDWDELAARAFAVGHEPQWSTGLSPGNLAQGRLTWSSARERPDCHEAALVDGDTGTRWCGPKPGPQSVVVDLGQSTDLSTVVLRWQTAFAKGYALDVSDDLRSWRSLAATSTGDGGLDVLPVTGRGRYLRLSMTERGTAFGYSLFEIEAYAPGAVVPAQFTTTLDPSVLLVSADEPGESALTVTSTSSVATTVTWSTDAADGAEVSPSSGTLQVPAGGEATATFEVSATEPGASPVRFTVTGSSGSGEPVEVAAPELLVSVPFARLAEAFTNTGVTDDADINPPGLGAGLDGAGSSYSAQALAGEGLTPGAGITVQDVPLSWPMSAPGTANNVVAHGQSVRVDAAGSSIGVLAAATYGPSSGDWVVHYADGTSSTIRLSTPDWTSAPPAGSTAVADMSYRNNTETGRTARRSQVFFQRIPVDPGLEVEALTLPNVSPTAVRGSAALHVFAVGIG